MTDASSLCQKVASATRWLVCSASYIVSLGSFPNLQYFFCNTFQSTMRRGWIPTPMHRSARSAQQAVPTPCRLLSPKIVYNENYQNATIDSHHRDCGFSQRRVQDSNLRTLLRANGFQDRRNRPLCQPSNITLKITPVSHLPPSCQLSGEHIRLSIKSVLYLNSHQ